VCGAGMGPARPSHAACPSGRGENRTYLLSPMWWSLLRLSTDLTNCRRCLARQPAAPLAAHYARDARCGAGSAGAGPLRQELCARIGAALLLLGVAAGIGPQGSTWAPTRRESYYWPAAKPWQTRASPGPLAPIAAGLLAA